MSGKVLIEWRHPFSAVLSKERYMNPNYTRSLHTEIANIFFNQDTSADNSSDDGSSEKSDVTQGRWDGKEARTRMSYFTVYSYSFNN